MFTVIFKLLSSCIFTDETKQGNTELLKIREKVSSTTKVNSTPLQVAFQNLSTSTKFGKIDFKSVYNKNTIATTDSNNQKETKENTVSQKSSFFFSTKFEIPRKEYKTATYKTLIQRLHQQTKTPKIFPSTVDENVSNRFSKFSTTTSEKKDKFITIKNLYNKTLTNVEETETHASPTISTFSLHSLQSKATQSNRPISTSNAPQKENDNFLTTFNPSKNDNKNPTKEALQIALSPSIRSPTTNIVSTFNPNILNLNSTVILNKNKTTKKTPINSEGLSIVFATTNDNIQTNHPYLLPTAMTGIIDTNKVKTNKKFSRIELHTTGTKNLVSQRTLTKSYLRIPLHTSNMQQTTPANTPIAGTFWETTLSTPNQMTNIKNTTKIYQVKNNSGEIFSKNINKTFINIPATTLLTLTENATKQKQFFSTSVLKNSQAAHLQNSTSVTNIISKKVTSTPIYIKSTAVPKQTKNQSFQLSLLPTNPVATNVKTKINPTAVSVETTDKKLDNDYSYQPDFTTSTLPLNVTTIENTSFLTGTMVQNSTFLSDILTSNSNTIVNQTGIGLEGDFTETFKINFSPATSPISNHSTFVTSISNTLSTGGNNQIEITPTFQTNRRQKMSEVTPPEIFKPTKTLSTNSNKKSNVSYDLTSTKYSPTSGIEIQRNQTTNFHTHNTKTIKHQTFLAQDELRDGTTMSVTDTSSMSIINVFYGNTTKRQFLTSGLSSKFKTTPSNKILMDISETINKKNNWSSLTTSDFESTSPQYRLTNKPQDEHTTNKYNATLKPESLTVEDFKTSTTTKETKESVSDTFIASNPLPTFTFSSKDVFRKISFTQNLNSNQTIQNFSSKLTLSHAANTSSTLLKTTEKPLKTTAFASETHTLKNPLTAFSQDDFSLSSYQAASIPKTIALKNKITTGSTFSSTIKNRYNLTTMNLESPSILTNLNFTSTSIPLSIALTNTHPKNFKRQPKTMMTTARYPRKKFTTFFSGSTSAIENPDFFQALTDNSLDSFETSTKSFDPNDVPLVATNHPLAQPLVSISEINFPPENLGMYIRCLYFLFSTWRILEVIC